MVVYVLTTLVSVFFAWLAKKMENNNRIKPLNIKKRLILICKFLAFFSIYIVAAIRQDVGTDYDSYQLMFNHIEWFGNIGTLFKLFIEFLQKISSDYHVVFIISSLLIYIPIFSVIFFESSLPPLSILMFVIMEDYFVSFNKVRQYMAIAFITVACLYIARNRWQMSIFFIILAGLIHPAAFVTLALLILDRLHLSKRQLAVSTLVASLGAFFAAGFIKNLLINYSVYGRYFFTHYANEQYSVGVPLLLIYIVIFIVILALCEENSLQNDSRMRLFSFSVSAGIIIMILSLRLTQNSYRLVYYFSVIIGIYFPNMLYHIPNMQNRRIVALGAISLFSIWTILMITHNNQDVLPYKTFLS